MKKILLWVVALAGVMGSVARAQDITGQWQGTLKFPNQQHRVVMKISKDNGEMKASFYLDIDQGGQSRPATSVEFQAPVLKIAIGSMSATYEGKLSVDGSSLEGAFKQGDSVSLTLTKATATTAWVIPPPPTRLPPMSPDAHPTFDVATIKPSDPNAKGIGINVAARHFRTHNTTVVDIVKFAYHLQAKQIVNGPSWLDADKFDIDAQPDGEGQPNDKQWREMLQKLLADRLKLAFHRDKKEMAVYLLQVAKIGPKLTKSEGDPTGLPGFGLRGPGIIPVHNASMAEFADFMSQVVMDRPVLDQTNLSGKFDFELKFTPDDSQFNGMFSKTPPADASLPGVFAAIQEELGLHLEATKAPADVLVIDHVEKPTEN